MHPVLSAICPTCKGNISDADRTCGQCGADVSVWPGVGRTPLILPGNPALSADEVRRRISPFRIVSGTVVGAAALFGALYLTSASEPEEPALLYATGTTSPTTALGDSSPSALVTVPPVAPPSPIASAIVASPAPTSMDGTGEPVLEPIPSTVGSATAVAAVAAAPAPAPPAAARVVSPTALAPRPAPVPLATPVLRLTPLVSDSLRPGELLQLRWSVQDRATGRPVKADMEFTSTDATVASVDRRTGIITARKPGRVRIVVDAGAGAETTVALTVRAAAMVAVTAAAATEPQQARTDAARSTSVIAASTPAAPIVTPAPPSALTPPPSPTPPRDARRDEVLPNEAEISSVVDRVVNDVRRSGARNAPVMDFLADGDGHRVALIGTPTSNSAGNGTLRVSFDLRLTKFDGGGRPVARVVPVSVTVDKRDGTLTSSAVSIGALRRQ